MYLPILALLGTLHTLTHLAVTQMYYQYNKAWITYGTISQCWMSFAGEQITFLNSMYSNFQ